MCNPYFYYCRLILFLVVDSCVISLIFLYDFSCSTTVESVFILLFPAVSFLHEFLQ